MKSRYSVFLLSLALGGCSAVQRVPPVQVWDDMKQQGKYMPQAASEFFADHRASRRPVEDTVARGYLKPDAVYETGISGDLYIGKNPETITPELLKTGQAKFNIYCSPCHSRLGDGKGIVALRTPSWQPSNLHEDRVRQQADGQVFNTISYGRRTMPGYRFQVTEHDRWAIVAYVRALQRTDGTTEDVPEKLRASLR